MPVFLPELLAAWSGGAWTRSPEIPITSVVHDSRTVVAGALFVAVAGEHFDGHDFFPSAAECGAAGGLCARGRACADLPCLEVDDPLTALRDIARAYRRTLGGLIIGVTGSAGKTTVKELLASILARRGDTSRTRGNWNNDIGLPLSLLRMEPTDDFGVFELGMNRPGEIAFLARILRPICGLITSIGAAHLEGVGSIEGIVHEKRELLAALPEEGVAIVDADSPWRERFVAVTRARVVTCALDGSADYVGRATGQGLEVSDFPHGLRFEVPLPLPGVHMMRNVLQAVTVAREFGLSPVEIQAGLEAFIPPPMRWERKTLGTWTVINDAYNANPLSLSGAIDTFAKLPHPGEKWVVLGGMSELGDCEESLHREIGDLLSHQSFAGLVAVGTKARWYAENAAPLPSVCVDTPAEAAEYLRNHAQSGAIFLLKASRSDGLERLIPLLISPTP